MSSPDISTPAQERRGASGSAPSDQAIDLRGVSKIYGGKVAALRGIDLSVRRGEVFGLLGPNGAGKSTLVKIMMTVVRPTRAQGTLLGRPVGHKPTLARVGYLPENHRFPRYLTGRQTLEFFAALSNVDRRTRKRRAAELLDTVGMIDWADVKVSSYSKGMMQRVGLAQAMMNDPDLLVLDEPTDGVDPAGRRDIRNVLAGLREQGKTVFVNSHLLGELEMVCDRVAILVEGQVARQGTIDELTVAKQRYEIEVMGDADVRARIFAALPGVFRDAQQGAPTSSSAAALPLPGFAAPAVGAQAAAMPLGSKPRPSAPGGIDCGTLADGQWVEFQGAVLRFGTTEAAELQPLLDALRRAGLGIRRVQLVRPSLEDLFLDTVTDRETGRSAQAGARIGEKQRGSR